MNSAHFAAVERFAAGAAVVAAEIAGLSREDLLARPIPGTWSIHEIVVHLCDSDLVGTDRMKRVIAEDKPLLLAYDENKFVARLGYDDISAAAAAELFRLNREMMAGILRRLPDEAFARYGIHSETGVKTLLDLVTGYAEHLDGHLVHLRKKRGLLGK
jgi:hypothetical protein